METGAEFYKMILSSLEEGIYVLDKNKRVVYWNKGAESITKFLDSEVLGQQDKVEFISDDYMNNKLKTKDLFSLVFASKKTLLKNGYLKTKLGEKLYVEMKLTPVFDHYKNVIGVVKLFRDISNKKQIAEKTKLLAKMAFIDEISGVESRKYGELTLNNLIEEVRKNGLKVGIILMELLNLKELNEKMGHNAGDRLLKEFGEKIKSKLNGEELICRWEGSRFLIFLKNEKESITILVAEKIKNILRKNELDFRMSNTMIKKGDSIQVIITRLEAKIKNKEQY